MKTRKGNFAVRLWALIFIVSAALCPEATFAAGSPSITTQPQSQSVLAGSIATFSVVASGQLPLSYQWSLNGTGLADSTHISGTTNTTLTIGNLVAGDAGDYQLVVSNSHGTAISSNATLIVLFPASIVTQPISQTVLLGSNATFTAMATGTLPLSYQWYFAGMP